MAVASLLMSSIFGFLSAVVGWALLDMPFLNAFVLYLVVSLGLGFLSIGLQVLRLEDRGPALSMQV